MASLGGSSLGRIEALENISDSEKLDTMPLIPPAWLYLSAMFEMAFFARSACSPNSATRSCTCVTALLAWL
ncbi:hypothetical protein D3C77_757140 [compost metagenome]